MPFLGRYEYTIDGSNTIRVYDTENPNENNEPFLLQPHSPNGLPWKDAEEAVTWLEAHFATD